MRQANLPGGGGGLLLFEPQRAGAELQVTAPERDGAGEGCSDGEGDGLLDDEDDGSNWEAYIPKGWIVK